MSGRIERIETLLREAFAPIRLELRDDSRLHAGHEGARDGRGHFAVELISAAFAGKSAVARHRMVYAALGDMLVTDIHALQIRALAPQEIENPQ